MNNFFSHMTERINPDSKSGNVWHQMKWEYILALLCTWANFGSRLTFITLWTTVFKRCMMKRVMSFNRFVAIDKFLHFVDNKELPENYDKFAKIEPIHAYLPEKFSTLYTPDRDISIDKLLLLWKGRTSWKQYIPSKCVRFVIKFFALCKSKSGYI